MHRLSDPRRGRQRPPRNLTVLIEAETAIDVYQTQSVRDLAWSCFAPPLLRVERLGQTQPPVIGDAAFSLTAERSQWLRALDRDPAPLLHHLNARKSSRLGLYFEALWHFFLAQDTRVDLLAHNLPVRDNGRTLGEFDCIYFCHTRQRHIHLELAVKYFLGIAGGVAGSVAGGEARWYGPNSQDRLDLKLSHMLDHQIRLGQAPQAKTALAELGVTALDREIALHGYLFQPAEALPAPAGVAPDYRFGRWVARGELTKFLQSLPTHRYLVLPRLRWLAPVALQAGDEPLQAAQLSSAVSLQPQRGFRPRLVAVLDEQGCETTRFFIVPDHWPEQSPP